MTINNYQKHFKFFIILIYAVGVAGLSLPASRELFQTLTPLNLLMMSGILFVFHRPWNGKTIALFAGIALAGFFAELAGVQTGLVFGDYGYGQTLGLQISGTPLLIGINWLILIYMVFHLLQDLQMHRTLKILLGALIMVSYDLLLEPVAIQLDFWNWQGGAIPLQNYVAWFAISVVFLSLLSLSSYRSENKVSNILLGSQFSFFLILNLTL
ncbi:MAG TPA: carotenoid biosynthesis protein [Bacteroidales bacterium]|nr:carotenoid biosynthesis protein [Bacteroidales bacterium]